MIRKVVFYVLVLLSSGVASDLKITDQYPSGECEIPNQDPTAGQCKDVSDCTAYLAIRNKETLTISRISFLRRLTCPTPGQICCPMGVNATYQHPTIEINRDEPRSRHTPGFFENRFGEDPTTDNDATINEFECGTFVTNKIIGGEIAGLEDYPWTALLLYNSSSKYGCSGAIISKRYVLTAAHCVTGKNATLGSLIGVRLGEYDTQGDPDCIQEADGYDCSDAAVEYDVEKVIVHPYYDPQSVSLHHDIALIKVTREIQYSLFVAPICIPQPNSSGVFHGTRMIIAGWGRTDKFQSRVGNILSPIKLFAMVTVVNQTECQEAYRHSQLQLGVGQLCAGGVKDVDSCPGDSGSVLMFFNPIMQKFVASGLVSLGKSDKGQLGCGAEGFPGVYTRTDQYVDWIRNAVHGN